MEQIDFDRIRKMPPDRRIKALRELQEKITAFIKERTKEIEESKKEISDAQDFLKEAEDELRVLEEIEATVPSIKKVNVEKLFEPEKKQGKERELEAIADEAPRTQPNTQDQEAYINRLAQQPVSTLYERINSIREEIKTTGILSAYQQEKLDQFRTALHEKEEAVRAGEYKPGKKAAHLMTAAERAIEYTSSHDSTFYKTRHENQ